MKSQQLCWFIIVLQLALPRALAGRYSGLDDGYRRPQRDVLPNSNTDRKIPNRFNAIPNGRDEETIRRRNAYNRPVEYGNMRQRMVPRDGSDDYLRNRLPSNMGVPMKAQTDMRGEGLSNANRPSKLRKIVRQNEGGGVEGLPNGQKPSMDPAVGQSAVMPPVNIPNPHLTCYVSPTPGLNPNTLSLHCVGHPEFDRDFHGNDNFGVNHIFQLLHAADLAKIGFSPLGPNQALPPVMGLAQDDMEPQSIAYPGALPQGQNGYVQPAHIQDIHGYYGMRIHNYVPNQYGMPNQPIDNNPSHFPEEEYLPPFPPGNSFVNGETFVSPVHQPEGPGQHPVHSQYPNLYPINPDLRPQRPVNPIHPPATNNGRPWQHPAQSWQPPANPWQFPANPWQRPVNTWHNYVHTTMRPVETSTDSSIMETVDVEHYTYPELRYDLITRKG